MAPQPDEYEIEQQAIRSRSSKRRSAGIGVSIAWVGGWALYGTYRLLCTADFPTKLNELGDFMAGIFSPLAFLWLVIGYFQQSDELRLQALVLRMQKEELELQRKATREIADQTTQDVFMRSADMMIAYLSFLCSRISDVHYPKPKDYEGEWLHFSQGRKNVFFDRILTMQNWDDTLNKPKLSFERIKGVYPDLKPLNEFCDHVEALLEQAGTCSPKLRQAYENSSLGLVYLLFCKEVSRPSKITRALGSMVKNLWH